MAKRTESRLCVAAFRGKEGIAGSFPLHSMDRDYIRACVKAFLAEYTRKHGTPERLKSWIE